MRSQRATDDVTMPIFAADPCPGLVDVLPGAFRQVGFIRFMGFGMKLLVIFTQPARNLTRRNLHAQPG